MTKDRSIPTDDSGLSPSWEAGSSATARGQKQKRPAPDGERPEENPPRRHPLVFRAARLHEERDAARADPGEEPAVDEHPRVVVVAEGGRGERGERNGDDDRETGARQCGPEKSPPERRGFSKTCVRPDNEVRRSSFKRCGRKALPPRTDIPRLCTPTLIPSSPSRRPRAEAASASSASRRRPSAPPACSKRSFPGAGQSPATLTSGR